jgi:hypothetical protein
MRTCCSQLGNGTVFVQDNCYAWCDVESPDVISFGDCLFTDSKDSDQIRNLGCGPTSDKEKDKSAGNLAYSAPKATVSALFCGILALSMLYV